MIRAGVVGILLFASLFGVVGARQDAPPAPKPLVPAAANSIAASPDTFYGQNVTVTAAVERVVSPTAFTVDQDPKSTAAEILVLVETLTSPLAVNSYVTVIGEVIRHEGGPAIRAASVITTAMVDIAKRPPPPLTAEEEAFDKVMKRVGPAFNSIRQAVAAASGETAAADAETLKAAFVETEAFWKKRSAADAQKWAAEARAQADVVARAVAAGKWDEAKAAAESLQQTCSSCHAAHRQRQDDGSYRMRTGSR